MPSATLIRRRCKPVVELPIETVLASVPSVADPLPIATESGPAAEAESPIATEPLAVAKAPSPHAKLSVPDPLAPPTVSPALEIPSPSVSNIHVAA